MHLYERDVPAAEERHDLGKESEQRHTTSRLLPPPYPHALFVVLAQVHFLKRPGGLEYIWRTLHDKEQHSAQQCVRWVWHDACRNPKDADTQWCKEHKDDKADDPNFVLKPVRAEDQKKAERKERKASKGAKV